jgi:hypothetical protein
MAYSARFLDELRGRTRLSEIVSYCGVKLVRRQREFLGLCPFHRERTPSFSVVDERHFYHCFGCGAHGDVFGFVMRIDNLDFAAAVAKLAGGLGVEMPSAVRAPIPDKQPDYREKEERNRRIAWRLWTAARDPRGTPVERYLHIRGLELPPAPVLRFASRCWNRETGLELPAMVARVDDQNGEFVAIHRTWLLPDGSGKAKLREPKWSLGPISRGAAVRLAPAGPALAIAEGIETALTAIVATGIPAWSALTAGGIQRLVLPTEVIEVVVIADHDRSGVGEQHAQLAADKWLRERRRVRIAMPPEPGADLNDVLLGCGKPRIKEDNIAA